MSSGWNALWDARPVPAPADSVLRTLMNGGGLDSGFAPVSEQAWVSYVSRLAAELSITPGETVFEVGCGAGAFLYELDRLGARVAGLDRSPALVGLARQALPRGRFGVADALELDVAQSADVVLSMGAFIYFPSEQYGLDVLARMVGCARRAVAVLDLPDRATRDAALEERARLAGGRAAYAARYRGLEHQYYDRGEFAYAMRAMGLREVHIEDQQLDGYHNAAFRFNAWGFR